MHNLVADLELPLGDLARICPPIASAAVLAQFVYRLRSAVALDVVRRSTNDQLNGHEPPRNRPSRGRRPTPETDIGASAHQVGELVIELDVELHFGMGLVE